MRRIVLAGFRGTGKTDSGRVLARRMGVPFIDTDALIELTTGRSIPEIFREDGEEGFRHIERKAIASLNPSDAVISTGGGAILDPANVELLRRNSTIVLLTADSAVIGQRIGKTTRPALTPLPADEEIRTLLGERERAYRACADLCVDTTSTTPSEAANAILVKLRSGPEEAARRQALEFFRSGRIPAPLLARMEEILGETDDAPTGILGVAGNPCAHSRGPALFNALFDRYGLRYHYTWFEHPDLKEIMDVAQGLGVKGLSVTIPFKQEVMTFLDETDRCAAEIGAVNTVVSCCGRTVGYNTDWIGIREPLEHAGLKGSKAVLLGAGGVAAAAAYALTDLGMDVTVLNRTPAKARELAGRFSCDWKEWDAFDRLNPDLVVNATPVGMHPDTGSPLRDEQLKSTMTVFDLVYTPAETPLLKAAAAKGCRTIPGTEMFIGQAREQFRLFFGIDVPTEIVRENLS